MLENLRIKALATLKANLVKTPSGEFFAAGGNQFRTLWVRDFCFAVPGLVAAGYQEVVLRQLELIFSCVRSDGLLPRGLDEVNPKLRVMAHTAFRFLPKAFGAHYRRAPRPEYLGEHGTPAFDSGHLFLLSLKFLEEKNVALPASLSGAWAMVLAWYRESIRDGLLFQPPFSDWQDSARREGFYLHTQLLYNDLAHYCESRHPEINLPLSAQQHGKRVREEFGLLPLGLMEESPGKGMAALDSQCRILKAGDGLFSAKEKEELWKALMRSPFFTEIGVPVFPPYESAEVSWTTKAVGLRHYHDGFSWGWLVAESAMVCYSRGEKKLGDDLLAKLASREKGEFLSEVYKDGEPLQSLLYRSECPFTWTAGKVLEAFAARP